MKPIVILAIVALIAGPAVGAGEISGKVVCKGLRSSADAVVYVDTIAGKTFEPPSEPVVVDQKAMVFVPHVQPVLVGTTVDFLNSDAFLHNVFSPDKCAEKFNLGSWPQGDKRSYTFAKPCVAELLCNVHPEMQGFVVAVPTPYFAVTAEDGTYTITDVPDGTYTVKAWHQKVSEGSQEVAVSGSANADFELKK